MTAGGKGSVSHMAPEVGTTYRCGENPLATYCPDALPDVVSTIVQGQVTCLTLSAYDLAPSCVRALPVRIQSLAC